MKMKKQSVSMCFLVAASILLPAFSCAAMPDHALSFDGIDDYVETSTAVIPSSGNFTVEFWAECPAAPGSYREIISQGSPGNAFYIGTDPSNHIRVGDGWGTVSPAVSFPVGGWHHFALVRSSANTFLYIDGVLAAARGSAMVNPAASFGLRFGRQYGGNGEYWPGGIGDVRVWNRDLAAGELQQSLTGSEANLVAWWRFNEGAGTTCTSVGSATVVGTLLNGPVWMTLLPAITVEQPAGTGLSGGTSAVGFGSVVHGASSTLTFTIRNTGTAPLSRLALAVEGTNAGDFTVGSLATTVLEAGDSTTFTVSFAAGVSGPRTAVLHVASNDPDKNPFDINLTGFSLPVGPLPNIVIEIPKGSAVPSGGSKNLGTVAAGKKLNATFTVHNNGNANLTGTAVSVTGPNAAEFKVTAKLTAAIKPGKTKTFKVQFAPASAGVKSAQLHITSNDPDGSPYLVNLTGTATAARDKSGAASEEFAEVSGGMGNDPEEEGDGQALTDESELASGRATASPAASPAPVELAGTTWSLPMTSRLSVAGVGTEDGQGKLRLTFGADGSLFVEDASGAGVWGSYAVDGEGRLSAHVFPQGVEDYVHAALGYGAGYGIAVDWADLNVGLTDDPGGPVMKVKFGFKAVVSSFDTNARKTIKTKMAYDVKAGGPRN